MIVTEMLIILCYEYYMNDTAYGCDRQNDQLKFVVLIFTIQHHINL